MEASIFLVILNLIVIESLLSVDNAAVLAVMVKDLPGDQKKKALRYGLVGAYAFRGLCLFLAAWLIKFMWLKIVGGVYLLYLVITHFTKGNDSIEEVSDVNDSKIYSFASKFGIGKFWSTVILVEVMDLAFSIDNVFAAVALSNTFWVIMVGVGIGILAMRFVAGWFVEIMKKYPFLENSAYIVIALLGLKLVLSGSLDYLPAMDGVRAVMEGHWFDLAFSSSMMLIFFFPILLNRKKKEIV